MNYLNILLIFINILPIYYQQSDFTLQIDPQVYEGQLNVYLNGEYKPICDDSINQNTINTVCQIMGYPHFDHYIIHQYDIDQTCTLTDDIFNMDELSCQGNESSVSECTYVGRENEDCSQTECIKVRCQNYKCGTQTANSMDCDSCVGANRSTPTCDCDSGFFENFPESLDCVADGTTTTGDIQIVGEQLQYYNKGLWKNVCDDKFDEFAAQVACKQLGFNSYETFQLDQTCTLLNSANEAEFWIDNIRCQGDEDTIENCEKEILGNHDCSINECIKLVCQNLPANDGNITQQDPNDNTKTSVIQIIHDSQTRFICDQGLDANMATVICRDLGFQTYVNYWGHQYCPGQDTVNFNDQNFQLSSFYWIGQMICTGNEQKIKFCRKPFGWEGTGSNCKENQCVQVQCTNDSSHSQEGQLRVSEKGIAELFYGDKWNQVCITQQLYAQNFAKVVCNNMGQVYQKHVMISYYNRQYQNADGTLNFGSKTDSEIYNEINIQIENEEYQDKVFDPSKIYCPQNANYILQDPLCLTGKEYNITDCNINRSYGDNSCNDEQCLYVQCQSNADTPILTTEFSTTTNRIYKTGDIQLHGSDNGLGPTGILIVSQVTGSTTNWGRVIDTSTDGSNEYDQANHVWGNGINKAAAHVICKSLGYGTFQQIKKQQTCPTDFPNNGFSNIKCSGQEQNLYECWHLGWGVVIDSTANYDNSCVEITCEPETCVLKISNELTYRSSTSSFPFCECQAGYFDDGYSQVCQKCADQCGTCIFNKDQCLSCSVSYSKFKYDLNTFENDLNPTPIEQNQPTILKFAQANYHQQVQVRYVDSDGFMNFHDDISQPDFKFYICQYCDYENGYYVKTPSPANTQDLEVCEKCEAQCARCKNSVSDCVTCTLGPNNENEGLIGSPPNCFCKSGYLQNSSTGICERCENDFFIIGENETQCNKCPDHATCVGTHEIKLDSGYWRHNMTSTNIVQCYNEKINCLGGSDPSPKVQCLEGHKGALCEACDLEGDVWGESYANSAQYDCAKCSGVSSNVWKIIGISVFQFIGMYLAVGGTITAIQDKMKFNCLKQLFNTQQPTPDEKGVLIKILTNYFFLFGVLATFQLEVPSDLRIFQSTVSNPAKNMSFSFDCFLWDMQKSIPNIYFRVIWQITVAVMQLMIVFLFLIILKLTKKLKTDIGTFMWCTIIYQFLSIQPSIISVTLENIACRKLGGQAYVLSNTSKLCYDFNSEWDSDYLYYTLLLMLPILLTITVGVPLILMLSIRFIALRKKKQKKQKVVIDLPKAQQKVQPIQSKNQIYPIDSLSKIINDVVGLKSKQNLPNEQQNKNENNANDPNKKDFDITSIDKNNNNNANINSQKKISQRIIQLNEEEKQHEEQIHKDEIRAQKYQEKIKKIGQDQHSQLDESTSLSKFGYLYLEYRNSAFLWEFVKIYQRTLVASILAFYYEDIKVKGILIFLVVFFYTILANRYKPYKLDIHNKIDMQSQVICAVTLILGLFLYNNDYSYWFIFGITIIALLNFYFIINMVQRLIAGKVRQILSKASQEKDRQEQQEQLDESLQEREEKLQAIEVLRSELNNYQNNPEQYEKEIKQTIQILDQIVHIINHIDEIIQSLDLVWQEQKLQKPEWPPLIDQQENGENTPASTNKHQRSSQQDDLKTSLNSQFVEYNNNIHNEKQQNFSQFNQKANPDTNIQKNDEEAQQLSSNNIELENKLRDISQKFQSSNTIKKKKPSKAVVFFGKVIAFMEKIGAKYFGQPTQQTLRQAKFFRLKFKKIMNQIFVQGCSLGFISLQNQESQGHLYTSKQFLEGKLSQQEMKKLQKMINSKKDLEIQNNQQIMQKVTKQIAKFIKESSSIPKQYYENQLQEEFNIQLTEEQQNKVDQIMDVTIMDDVNEIYYSFKLFDPDNSGVITSAEFNQIMKELGQNLSKKELDEMIAQVDQDKNGEMDFCEFTSLIQFGKVFQKTIDPQIQEIFMWYNFMSDGQISIDDLYLLYKTILKQEVETQILHEIIRQVDGDADGKLTYLEFRKLLL